MNIIFRADSSYMIPDLTVYQESDFRKIIEADKSAPVLAIPKNGFSYSFDRDPLPYQVGAELLQMEEEKNIRPVGLCSRMLNTNENITRLVRRKFLQLYGHWYLQDLTLYSSASLYTPVMSV